jgi:hypothetical protein
MAQPEVGRSVPKVDFRKQLKHLYQPSAKVLSVVNVPELNFLIVDGQGNPNTLQ